MSRCCELLDRLQMVQGRDHAVEVQIQVPVDQHVTQLWQFRQLSSESWRKLGYQGEIPDRVRIALDGPSLPEGDVTRQLDHRLTDIEEGEENIIAERKVKAEGFGPRDSSTKGAQMPQVEVQLCKALFHGTSIFRSILPSSGVPHRVTILPRHSPKGCVAGGGWCIVDTGNPDHSVNPSYLRRT